MEPINADLTNLFGLACTSGLMVWVAFSFAFWISSLFDNTASNIERGIE